MTRKSFLVTVILSSFTLLLSSEPVLYTSGLVLASSSILEVDLDLHAITAKAFGKYNLEHN